MNREEYLYAELRDIASMTHSTVKTPLDIALHAREVIKNYDKWKKDEESLSDTSAILNIEDSSGWTP